MTATDLVHVDTGELAAALVLQQAPTETLAEAQRAATALQDVIRRKAKPVIFGGEQYLEFEDWQTLGRFYGVTTRVERVEPVSFGPVTGFHASAVAILADGRVISRVESYCTDDEANWRGKPRFQLASMSQTRACVKALRHVLSWVVVLAGYKGTPAEEIEPQRRAEAQATRKPRTPASALIDKDQQRRFFGVAKQQGWTDAELKTFLQGDGYTKSSQIPRTDYDRLISALHDPPAPAPKDPDAA